MPVPTRLYASRQRLFEGDCDFIVAQGASGELGVLPGHAPLLTWLKPGEVMLRQGTEEHFYFLEGGYLEVLPNRVSILAEAATLSSELDPAAAEEERQAAAEAISGPTGPEPEELAARRRRLDIATQRLQAAQRDQRRHRD